MNPEGLVMLSSHPDLPIASIDLNAARSKGKELRQALRASLAAAAVGHEIKLL
ncbi:MAG: hypothetical protein ACKO9A_09235 [Alphaproteobacteria bacterium]